MPGWTSSLCKRCLHKASWIRNGDAWIELGQDDYSHSFVRILDIGGLIHKSDERYEGVDQALHAAERALADGTQVRL